MDSKIVSSLVLIWIVMISGCIGQKSTGDTLLDARRAVSEMKEAADFIYVHGHPSEVKLIVRMPEGVNEFKIEGKTVRIGVRNGTDYVYFQENTKMNLFFNGNPPISKGIYDFIFRSTEGDEINISILPDCTGFSQVRPIDWKADSSENKIILLLISREGTNIRLDSVRVDVFGSACSKLSNEELRAGQSIQVNVTGCTFPNAGYFYRADVDISYTNIASGTQEKSIGECHGDVE